jgi:hypothetical protein
VAFSHAFMIELVDFQPYIQSILDSSQKDGDWGNLYIPIRRLGK